MATGIRQGRARFGDDVRERAKKYFAEQEAKKSAPTAAATPAPKAKSKAAAKPKVIPMKEAAKANPVVKQMGEADKVAKEVTKSKYGSAVPEQPEYQRTKGMKPPASPKDKAAAAREKMFEKSGPIGDIAKAMTPAPKSPYSGLETEARRGQIERSKATPYSEAMSNRGEGGPRLMPRGAMMRQQEQEKRDLEGLKKGGKVKAKGSSVSKRADGCAQRGKTKGRMI